MCLFARRLSALLVQMAFLVGMYRVPPELVVNSYQTGVPFVPAPLYNWAQKGPKDVSANGNVEKACAAK